MPTIPSDQEAPNRLEGQFLELVLADAQLLQAEFDAIVEREWAGRPPTGHRESSPAAPQPRASLAPPDWGRSVPRRPRRPGVGGWRRQRSPPTLEGGPPKPPLRQTVKGGGSTDLG